MEFKVMPCHAREEFAEFAEFARRDCRYCRPHEGTTRVLLKICQWPKSPCWNQHRQPGEAHVFLDMQNMQKKCWNHKRTSQEHLESWWIMRKKTRKTQQSQSHLHTRRWAVRCQQDYCLCIWRMPYFPVSSVSSYPELQRFQPIRALLSSITSESGMVGLIYSTTSHHSHLSSLSILASPIMFQGQASMISNCEYCAQISLC